MADYHKAKICLRSLPVGTCYGLLRSMAIAVLCITPILVAKTAAAEESAEASVPSAQAKVTLPRGEPVVIDVSFNHVKRGVYPIVLTQEGDFLLRGDDLRTIGVVPPYGAQVIIGGEEYFSLSRMGATSISVNENLLTLYADLPPERWPKQNADLRSHKFPHLIYPHDNSAYFNYRVLNTGSDSGTIDAWVLGGEAGIRYNDFLFRSESVYQRQGDQGQNIRYGTSITHDNRETLQRVIVGDFVTSSGSLGSTLNLGGISLTKTYSIDPYYVRQPTGGFVSTIIAPSEVDIYLDGVRVRTDTLQPGQFEVKNLNYYSGLHDLEMVVRDAFGREQRTVYPYYFSDQNLRQGLHDYSYNLGRMRTAVGTPDDSYGDWAFSAYHRYGISDDLTMGMRGDAAAAINNFGPSAVLRLDHWGVFSGAFSRSMSDNGVGWAGTAGYGYQTRSYSFVGSLRRYTSSYEQVGLPFNTSRPRQELTATVGYALRSTSNLSLTAHNQTYYEGVDQKTVSLTYSRSLDRAFFVTAGVGRTIAPDSSNNFYLMLNYFPGKSFTGSLTHQQNGDNYSDTIQVGNVMPAGEGLGYRFISDRTVNDNVESMRLAPWMQYNARHAIYMANVQSVQTGGDTQTAYQWGVSGGIAYVADNVSFTRPITDSFALVDVGNLEGVRVYSSAQEIGRTDKNGQVFLPNIGSYVVNRISVDDRDIPIDYSLKAKEVNMSPSLRSGSLIHFDVKQLQAVMGRLHVKIGDKWVPAEYSELTLEINLRKAVFPTGHDGDFYAENVPTGTYKAQIDYQGKRCGFELLIPKSSESLIELGAVNACELAR